MKEFIGFTKEILGFELLYDKHDKKGGRLAKLPIWRRKNPYQHP